MSDYEIARKLRVDAGNVTRSRLTALRKIERAQANLDFGHLKRKLGEERI